MIIADQEATVDEIWKTLADMPSLPFVHFSGEWHAIMYPYGVLCHIKFKPTKTEIGNNVQLLLVVMCVFCVQNLHRPFDAERYKQCVDYLSYYGSHYQHISFVYKWCGMQDAITTFKQMVIS